MLSARSALVARPIAARPSVQRAAARASVVSGAVARDAAWFPGTSAPESLDGTLTGDFGFDPLGLSADKEKLKWYVQAELVHGRWAMLGAAGVLAPDVFAHIGLSTAPGAPTNWVDAQTYTYWGSAATIGIVNLWLVSWAEHRRGQDIAAPGSASDDPIFTSNKLPKGEVGYPGGIFDPMNMSSPERKLKEIKNGRLAMVAWLGFIAQAAHTGSYSPIDNLATHLAAPFSTTVLSNFPDLFVWRWNDPTFLANVAPIKGLPLV